MKNLGHPQRARLPVPVAAAARPALAAAEASLAYLGAIEHEAPPRAPTRAPLRRSAAAAAAAAAAMAAPAAASRAAGDGAPSPRWAGCSPALTPRTPRQAAARRPPGRSARARIALVAMRRAFRSDRPQQTRRRRRRRRRAPPPPRAAAAAANDGRWRCAESRPSGGAGVYLQWRSLGGGERGGGADWQRTPKVLAEAELLVAQLRRHAGSSRFRPAPPPAAPPAAPPTAAQATALRRALAGGAARPRRAPRRARGHDGRTATSPRLGDGVKPAVLRKAFVGAQAAGALTVTSEHRAARAKPKAQYDGLLRD